MSYATHSTRDTPNAELQIVAALRKILEYRYSVGECQEAARAAMKYLDDQARERLHKWVEAIEKVQFRTGVSRNEPEFQQQMRDAIDNHMREHQKLTRAHNGLQ